MSTSHSSKDFSPSSSFGWISFDPSIGWIENEVRLERVANVDERKVHGGILPRQQSIVLGKVALVVEVEVAFEPLDKLQVVLVFPFAQFFDVDVFLDFAFAEALLQNFEVRNELPFVSGAPVDSGHGHFSWVHGVDELAIDGPCAQLFDLFDFELEGSVHPIQEVGFGDEEGPLHHANTLILVHLKKYIMTFTYHLISTILVVSLLLWSVRGDPAQKFIYNAQDILVVEALSTVQVSLQLTTTADEYLSESDLEVELQMSSIGEIMPYDIFYFTYQSQDGQNCYSKWVMNRSIDNQMNCSKLAEQDFFDLPTCCKYVHCSVENITLRISLSEQLYRQSFLIIQNNNPSPLFLTTSINMNLTSDNIWFYWGVGLTCLLLISLAIFTGIVFYWILKYKRVKKMFEQFKLTEQNVKEQ